MGTLQALPHSILPVHTGKSLSMYVCVQSWTASSPECLARCLTRKRRGTNAKMGSIVERGMGRGWKTEREG